MTNGLNKCFPFKSRNSSSEGSDVCVRNLLSTKGMSSLTKKSGFQRSNELKTTRLFNATVVGLTGRSTGGNDFAVGKSALCKAFVDGSYDSFIQEHKIVFSKEEVSHPAIGNDNLLYWGLKSISGPEDGVNFAVRVLEQTYVRHEESSEPSPEELLKRFTRKSLRLVGKSQIHTLNPTVNNGVRNKDDILSDEIFTVDGVVVVIDGSDSSVGFGLQLNFLILLCENLSKLEITFVIAVSKLDINRNSKNLDAIRKVIESKKFETIICETSAQVGVNVSETFRALCLSDDVKKRGKLTPLPFLDAYKQVAARRNLAAQNLRTMLNKLDDIPWDVEKVYEKYSSPVIADCIYENGRQTFDQVTNNYIMASKMKVEIDLWKTYERMFRKFLIKYFPTLASLTKYKFRWNEFAADVMENPTFDSMIDRTDRPWNHIDALTEHRINMIKTESILSVPTKIQSSPSFSSTQDLTQIYLPIEVFWKSKSQKIFLDHIQTLKTHDNLFKDRKKLYECLMSMVAFNHLKVNSTQETIKMYLENTGKPEFAKMIDDEQYQMVIGWVMKEAKRRAEREFHELLYEKYTMVEDLYHGKTSVKGFLKEISVDPRSLVEDDIGSSYAEEWIRYHLMLTRNPNKCIFEQFDEQCIDKFSSYMTKFVFSRMTKQHVNPNEYAGTVSSGDSAKILFAIISSKISFEIFKAHFQKHSHEDSQFVFELDGISYCVDFVNITSPQDETVDILRNSDGYFKKVLIGIYENHQNLEFVKNMYREVAKRFNQNTGGSFSGSEPLSGKKLVLAAKESGIFIGEYKLFLFLMEDTANRPDYIFKNAFTSAGFDNQNEHKELCEEGSEFAQSVGGQWIDFDSLLLTEKQLNTLHISAITVQETLMTVLESKESESAKEKENTNESDFDILVCGMCGDYFPYEVILGLFINSLELIDVKYAKDSLKIEIKNQGETPYWISIKFTSYHRAYSLFKERKIGGCVCTYREGRLASESVMRHFVALMRNVPAFLIGFVGETSSISIITKYLHNKPSAESMKDECDFDKYISYCRSHYQQISNNHPYDPNSSGSSISEDSRKLKDILKDFMWVHNPSFNKNQSSGSSTIRPADSKISNSKASRRKSDDGIFGTSGQNGTDLWKNTERSKSKSLSMECEATAHNIKKNDKNVLRKNPQSNTKINAISKIASIFQDYVKKPPPTQSTSSKIGVSKDLLQDSYFRETITELCVDGNPPKVMAACINYIEKIGLKEVGIYRVSGNRTHLEELKQTCKYIECLDFSSLPYGIHTYTSLIKMFLAQTPNAVIPSQFNDRIKTAMVLPEAEQRLESTKEIINDLPPCHQLTLKTLIFHLAKVASHSEENMMHCGNIARVIWPSILRISDKDLMNASSFIMFIQNLLEQPDIIFVS